VRRGKATLQNEAGLGVSDLISVVSPVGSQRFGTWRKRNVDVIPDKLTDSAESDGSGEPTEMRALRNSC
jgi:hypothetical protein